MIYHMTRGLKFTGYALAVLFVLAAGLVLYLKSLDFNDYKPQIQQAVQQATGRALHIDGQLELSISLHPALVVEGVHLANAAGGSRKTMVDVERMELELGLLPLLSGNLYVKRLVLIRPDVLLETLTDGSDNWVMAGPEGEGAAPEEGAATSASSVMLPQVHRILIKEAKLSYRDAKSRETQSLSLPEVELWQESDDSDAPFKLSVVGKFNNIPLTVEGELTTLSALADNEQIEIALRSAVAGSEIQVNGSVAKPLDGKGIALVLNLSAPDIATLGSMIDVPLAHYPLHLKAMLKDSADGFDLSGLQVNVGNSDVTGDVRLALIEPRPRINVALQSERFSLDDILPAKKGAAAQQKAGKDAKADKPKRVFPAEPLDLKGLKSVDADIVYKANIFTVSGMQMSDVGVNMQLSDGVLKIAPLKAGLAGGKVKMSLLLRGDQSPARLKLAITGRNIIAAQLVEQRAGQKGKDKEAAGGPLMEGGSLNVDVNLKGRGVSVADIMGRSNGRIKLRLGKAKVKSDAMILIGGDMLMTLTDKLNPFSERSPYVELQCGVVHFRVENGVMLSEDGIAFKTTRMNILSHGKINLKDESIDLSIGTEPRKGLGVNVSNMVNVVRLGGTLAEPGIRMDVAKSGKAVARVAGAIATGGLSLLGEGLFNRATEDSSPCKTALEMK